MYRIDRGVRHAARQEGTTLILALVLVLLATLMGLFAMNVGMFGQRISASDVRARLTRQTAEAALSQGIEYFRNNNTLISDPTTSAVWQLCLANDTSYPCGTVDQCPGAGLTDGTNTSTDSTHCTGDLQRRGHMYRYIGKANYDVNGSGGSTDLMDNRSLPLSSQMPLMATVGSGYGVNYGVGALLCVVKTPVKSTDPTECTTSSTNASSVRILTLTSVASIPGENTSTTLTTGFGMHSVLYSPTNKPPVVASGSVDITGGIQVVTNPDAGGNGVPVSIWTRKAVSKTGTPNTCYFDDFIRDQKNNASPAFEPNSPLAATSTSTVVTCDTCECSNSLSYQSSGNSQEMGIDILDVDSVPVIGSTACTTALFNAGSCKANVSVIMDPTIPQFEFPCDMFQYVFGVQAWSDNDTTPDGFCETRMSTTITVGDGTPQTMGADEAYLYQNATQIIAGTLHPPGWIDPSKKFTDCSPLTNSTGSTAQGGLIWVQYGANCSFGATLQIGTPDLPVVLVVDGNMTGSQVYHSRMFGLLFVRAPDTPLDPATGGSTSGHGGSLFMNSGSVIYGSVVIQGQMIRGNGTASVVYNKTVLDHLLAEPGLNPFAPVPASWTDRFAY